MPSTGLHIVGESETHFFEADVEVDYKLDEESKRYPVRFRWYDVTATDKQTNESEFWGEEMPDSLLNVATDQAESDFYEQY